jgi:acetyl esterase/lipase
MRWPSILLLLLGIGITQPALAQAAGTLIAFDPLTDTPPGTQGWHVRYATRDQDGRPIVATGLVYAPREAMPARPRMVIAWTHGAWGVAEKCAPSLSTDFVAMTAAVPDAVRRGYVVVAPDYPGLGSDSVHAFLIGRETAQSVLDAVRAARGIPGAAAGSRFAVWGESQGGHAALWTASEAARYAPDLKLVGTAAAAPPTQLADNFRLGSDPNARALLTAFALYSWSQRLGAPISNVLGKVNEGVALRLARNNCVVLDAKPKLGTILGMVALKGGLKGKDIGSIAPWSNIARANSVDANRVAGPLLIAQGDKDTIVAPSVTRAFALRACAAGKRVKYVRLPGTEHAHSARDSSAQTLDWIDARFARTVAPSSCGRI